MRLSLREIYVTLFLTGIFFIPFNSFMGIQGLGEFKREAGSYFLLLGFLILLIDSYLTKSIRIPYRAFLFQLLLIFFFLTILSIIVNLPSVWDNYFKKTTGINRFVRQIFVLFLSGFAFFLLYWNVIAKMSIQDVLYKIRKAFLCSFIVVSIYGFLEILFHVFGFYPAYTVLRLFDYLPFVEYDSDNRNRISSVCFEAPALATFLITASGWMFSYIITNKGFLKYVPTVVVIILTYFSGSRTALVVILVQLVVFCSILLSRKQKMMVLLYTVFGILFFSGFVILSKGDKIIRDVEKKIESLDFRGNLKKDISNQSRIGIQYANLVVFTENPVFGVGYGQQAYHAMFHYPLWAKKNNWEFKERYLNKNDPMFPPGYNLYVRLLAEMGIVGFLFFSFFLYTIVKQTNRIIKNQLSNEEKALAIILQVTFVGFIFNWLQLDTFRMYGFWIGLAILIKLSTEINTKLNEK